MKPIVHLPLTAPILRTPLDEYRIDPTFEMLIIEERTIAADFFVRKDLDHWNADRANDSTRSSIIPRDVAFKDPPKLGANSFQHPPPRSSEAIILTSENSQSSPHVAEIDEKSSAALQNFHPAANPTTNIATPQRKIIAPSFHVARLNAARLHFSSLPI